MLSFAVWEWTEWNTCNGTCDQGLREREYRCKVPQCHHEQPPDSPDTETCNAYDLPGD